MIKYKITWETINLHLVQNYKRAVNSSGKEIANSLFDWYPIEAISDFLNNQQLTQLMAWEASGEGPIRNVKLFKADINWKEVKQEDMVSI